MTRLFATIGDRFRALMGDVDPAPRPDAGEIARRHTRKLVAALIEDPDHFEVHADGAGDVYHVDLSPAAEDLVAARIKAAIDEDRGGRPT